MLFGGLVLGLSALAQEEERYLTVDFGKISEADTLHWGWLDTRSKDLEQATALVRQYMELYQQRDQYEANQAIGGMDTNPEIQKLIRENDAYWENYRKAIQDMLKQGGLGADERKALQQQLEDIDKEKETIRQQILASVQSQAAEGRAATEGVDPSAFSEERLMALKKDIRKYLLGKRFWNFSAARQFHNGFVAVAYAKPDGANRWGFLNRQGRLVIPCRWDEVFDFNNRPYYARSVFDYAEDNDDRPWTSVRSGSLLGMIDTTGRVQVPVKFASPGRAQLLFRKTRRGELADAKDAKTRQWGLIDRRGNWVIAPSLPELWWDDETQSFWYQDPAGNPVEVKL